MIYKSVRPQIVPNEAQFILVESAVRRTYEFKDRIVLDEEVNLKRFQLVWTRIAARVYWN